ncbi:hypothetical protein C8F04DRAFT_1309708 [Mycena alexandri]|uniref:Uncharacterized protein n=1 Tax=Mycena alexandri TaxID=1745969 RepID=A0AAD6X9Y4_9AGAR|nr:hypothetical protein C8F04DRAFT_1309708 [Mycena alexandri]
MSRIQWDGSQKTCGLADFRLSRANKSSAKLSKVKCGKRDAASSLEYCLPRTMTLPPTPPCQYTNHQSYTAAHKASYPRIRRRRTTSITPDVSDLVELIPQVSNGKRGAYGSARICSAMELDRQRVGSCNYKASDNLTMNLAFTWPSMFLVKDRLASPRARLLPMPASKCIVMAQASPRHADS